MVLQSASTEAVSTGLRPGGCPEQGERPMAFPRAEIVGSSVVWLRTDSGNPTGAGRGAIPWAKNNEAVFPTRGFLGHRCAAWLNACTNLSERKASVQVRERNCDAGTLFVGATHGGRALGILVDTIVGAVRSEGKSGYVGPFQRLARSLRAPPISFPRHRDARA